jgi:hypothetical protein
MDKELKEKIRIEFLSILDNKNDGYILPLYKILEWLDISYEDNIYFRRQFKEKYLNNEKYRLVEALSEEDKTASFIIRKDKQNQRKKIIWFSIDGFKTLCLIMDKSKKASLVREYFLELENDYMRVLEQTTEENKKEFDLLQNQIKEYNKENKLLSIKNQELQIKVNRLSIINSNLSNDAQDVQKVKDLLHKNYLNLYNIETIGLNIYEELYGKKSIIYLVNDKYVNNEILKFSIIKPEKSRGRPRKIKLNNIKYSDNELSDDDNIKNNIPIIDYTAKFKLESDAIEYLNLLNYEEFLGIPFEYITIEYLKSLDYDIDYPLYFYISKPDSKIRENQDNFKPISNLYFLNINHYNEFIKELDNYMAKFNIPNVKKIFNGIYKLPYFNILETKNNILIQARLNLVKL